MRRPDFPLGSGQRGKVGCSVKKETEGIDGQRRRGFRAVKLAGPDLVAGCGVENRLDLGSGHAWQESLAHPFVPFDSIDIPGSVFVVPVRRPEYHTARSICVGLHETLRGE